jgi:glycosyltransferase involved in cell wall biosynthesis
LHSGISRHETGANRFSLCAHDADHLQCRAATGRQAWSRPAAARPYPHGRHVRGQCAPLAASREGRFSVARRQAQWKSYSGGAKVTSGGPRFPEVGIVAIVPDEWDGVSTTRHHVLRRLSEHYHILWVEPALGWRDWWLPPRTAWSRSRMARQVLPGLAVQGQSPWTPEVFRPAVVARFLRRWRIRHAVRLLHQRGCRRIVVYLWRPEFDYALDDIRHDLSVYHIDDEYSFSDEEQPTTPREKQLIGRVDQVVIHSRSLMEKKGHINPATIRIPNGVDYRAYAEPVPEPDDLRTIPRPRIGYVGVLKKQLDLTVLEDIAQRRPDWRLVLVGPVGYLGDRDEAFRRLIAQPNVVSLGPRAVSALPAYVQHLDVCLLCYEVNGYTRYIHPLKLNEYLAAGRPIVGSAIDSVLEAEAVVQIARTSDEWIAAIEKALRTDRPQDAQARRETAARSDWDVLVLRLARVIAARLSPDLARTVDRLAESLQLERRSGTARDASGGPQTR